VSTDLEIDARRGDWMQTFTGGQFWPYDPRPEDVRIADIAHALALENRFAGHTAEPYSVAQHSVLVAKIAATYLYEPNPNLVLAALLHDAAEAYVKDIPRPLKRGLLGYHDIESAVADAIEKAFRLAPDDGDRKLITLCDERALATERRDVFPAGAGRAWRVRAQPFEETCSVWPWQRAEVEFLNAFAALMEARAS
jgi:uncharacterized protein